MDALLGITYEDWLKLHSENRITFRFKYMKRAFFLILLSHRNTKGKIREEQEFGPQYENVEIPPPVFILGHWRSGTTMLHSLMIQNEAFAYANALQISHPHTFLLREKRMQAHIDKLKKKSYKRPMDNITVQFDSPGEDENGIAIMSLRSPVISWTFPQNESFYARYHTFEDAPQEDFERWKNALVTFYKKLTWRYDNKPLILKSPVHTARVRILLDLFPNAKFIHIYRNPYRVFQSTRKLYNSLLPLTSLQEPPTEQYDDIIIRNYKTIYDAYLAEKDLIPKGHLIELPYEELVKDKMGWIEKIHRELNLPDFEAAKPKLEEYLKSISNYKNNNHKPIETNLKQRLQTEWAKYFEAFGYDPV